MDWSAPADVRVLLPPLTVITGGQIERCATAPPGSIRQGCG
jgi:hypothetical protein